MLVGKRVLSNNWRRLLNASTPEGRVFGKDFGLSYVLVKKNPDFKVYGPSGEVEAEACRPLALMCVGISG
jgi:hypothetical protein